MSLLLRRCFFGPVVAAAIAASAAIALADDAPPATAPDPSAAAQPEPAAGSAPAPGTAPPAGAPTTGPAPTGAPLPATTALPGPGIGAPAPGGGDTPLYRVVDGNHVDPNTMKGWRAWRAMACERCHGPNQEGLVGPSLVDDLKTLSKEDFKKCVLEGRIDKGMPNFGGVKTVTDNIDNLYAFLKGRSDGAIPPGHLKEIE